MNNFFNEILAKFKEIYDRLDPKQKLVLGALVIITVGLFAFLITWATRTDYGLLFGNMPQNEAAEVIKKLEDLNITYQLQNSGRSIMIPAKMVHKTRIQLSSDGIGMSNESGFEIFDKSTLGMTERIQDINWIRAMQGELQRTISSINGIETARVHLVIPAEKIFKEDEIPASASVLIGLQRKLSENKVQGIANLIASAIEGLDAERVTILDTRGNVLTENYDESYAGLSNKQLKIQREVEKQLASKVTSMLDKIYGRGNSDVRVSADLNFDNIETTSEQYDPASQVTRSEELQSANSNALADSLNEGSEHLITNYEINKTIQHITKRTGNIKKLSVSVNINHKLALREENGELIKEYSERSATELAQIEASVQNAVGFDSSRGDKVVVNAVLFDTTTDDYFAQQQDSNLKRRDLIKTAEKGGVLIILSILVFVLFSQLRKALIPHEAEDEMIRAALAEGEVDTEGFYPEGEEGLPMGDGKITYSFKPMRDIEIEQTAAQQLQDSVRKFVSENPELAVRLIKTWLLEKKGL